jgi:hypothetical protein
MGFKEEIFFTVPGGRMASNRSTPNIPRLERVKVPTEAEKEHNGKASEK